MKIPKRLHALAVTCDTSHLFCECSINPKNETSINNLSSRGMCPKGDEDSGTAPQIMSASGLFIKRLLKNELYSEESLSVFAVSHGCTCGGIPFVDSSMLHWYV